TSVEDILTAADVGASQLYHYFGDKQGLVRAVIAHQADAIIARQRPLLDQLDTFEALQEWRDGVVDRQRRRDCVGGCIVGSLAAQLAETQPEVRPDLASAFRRWEDPIQRGLQAMKDRGALRPEADARQLALGLLAALQGGLLLSQTSRETAPLEAALDCMLGYIKTLAA
ncbi:MAG: transcriptional regulator, TetR family, partial [Pseudonocardiales bacterium]|nr:transcriptional regulator, TetR family [Pseudonocardiales bacterium]